MTVPLPRTTKDLIALSSLPDPYPVYAELRRSSPVHRLEDRNIVLVSRYSDVTAALRAPEIFSSTAQAGMDSMLLGADAPVHTRMRRPLAKAFAASQMLRLADAIQAAAHELLDDLQKRGGVVDLVAGYTNVIPTDVMRELLQLDASLGHAFHRWADALALIADSPGQASAAVHAETVEEFRRYLVDQHLPHCAVSGRRGLVSDLLSGHGLDGDILTQEQLLGLIRLFVFAGIETVRNLMSNSILTFLRHPPTWERLRSEPDLLPRAIEEVLRFESPVQTLHRFTLCEADLAGIRLPRGTLAVILLGSANRDEERFPQADRFWIERDDAGHVGLGTGIHFCIGSHLARLQARIALETLLARFPALTPAEPLHAVPLADSFTTRGPRRILVNLG